VEFPIRQTVSWAGTEPDEEDGVLLDPHPAARAVRAEAARMAAAAFLFLTFAVSLRVVQAQGWLVRAGEPVDGAGAARRRPPVTGWVSLSGTG
jgi:hypothetical protein